MTLQKCKHLLIAAMFLAVTAMMAAAQDAKVRVVVVAPEEGYIFVDGQPVIHRTNTLTLTPGEHTIGVYNYGFVPQINKVWLKEGQNPEIEARLQPVAGMVSGPWGRIQIEGIHNGAAVFLNEKLPEFFVGHTDEMNHEILATQQLVVPPGTHQVFVVEPKTSRELWSGPVKVLENQRVIVDVNKGTQIYKPWTDGEKARSFKRFEAGTATASIAVAPVTGKLMADRTLVNCGEPVKLTWHTTEAVRTTIMADNQSLGVLPLSGEQTVYPKQDTTYEFRTVGPGGTVTATEAVKIKNAVKTSLTAFPAEIRYHRVGDRVIEQGSSTLRWTAANADSVRIDPIGTVSGASGEKTIQAMPKIEGAGTIDEVQNYKITATNACGGTDTSMVSVHVTGEVEPEQVAAKEELPHTGSPLPLLGLLGLASAAGAAALRWARKLV